MGIVCGILERGDSEMIFLLLILTSFANASPVKELPLKPGDIGTINTAIGYSTVIQLTQKPLNVVIGDQSAFRIEFINDSLTIKPVRPSAKTNLFIFTENDRFNLTIKDGVAAKVDYVVRLRRIFSDPRKAALLNDSRIAKGLKLTLIRISQRENGSFLDFTLENKRKKAVSISPENIRLVVSGNVRPINSLYIDHTLIKPSNVISGSLSAPSFGLKNTVTIWFGLPGEKPVKFVFSKKASPKNKEEVLRAF